MANIIKAPVTGSRKHSASVFLAGTIEMGKAVDWQKQIEQELEHLDVDIFNPRRDDWDASWEQSIHNPQFKEQVTWELDRLDEASIIFMYFVPGMMSPISLLEFGLHSNSQKMIVVCPDGFWRKGNVEVVCDRLGIRFFHTLDEGIAFLKSAAYLDILSV